MTCATAPAIATDVASTTLPVIRYSARNTIVEKKSVASLANTSFIVVLHWGASRHCEEQGDEAIQSSLGVRGGGIASRSLSPGAHSRDPLARNDVLCSASAFIAPRPMPPAQHTLRAGIEGTTW